MPSDKMEIRVQIGERRLNDDDGGGCGARMVLPITEVSLEILVEKNTIMRMTIILIMYRFFVINDDFYEDEDGDHDDYDDGDDYHR